MIYGYVQLEETQRLENGKLVLGCIATQYNRQGEIISRTKTDSVELFFPNKKMTAQEARSLGAKV